MDPFVRTKSRWDEDELEFDIYQRCVGAG